MESKPGEGQTVNMTEDVRHISIKLRPEIETSTNRKFSTFIPLLYRRNQAVNGISYCVKILVEPAVKNMLNECIHVNVFETGGCLHMDKLKNVVQERTVLESF
ncbi:hypothetical protein CHS0354_036336 [Potamilus streckersoni]|uniref:Uncharacterized protein n=1 Tax=Potamilus streckersoni TaxID=2493646 RepID=A0AAE0SEN0_9BIVA|nr:hypothetical protein CHS0354_036336 [Potamilus streckersoni]